MKLHVVMLRLVAGAALAECASVGPNYKPPELAVPEQWSSLDPAAAPVTAAGASADLGRWWTTLNDPLLSELVAQAVTSSPDVRIAAARVREARARRSVAAAGWYPSVGASANARRSTSISPLADTRITRNAYSAGLDANWELDLFGGVRRGVEAAEADRASAEENLHGARVSLAAEVALTYVDLRALQIRLQIAERNLASQAETLALTEWRAQAGLVNGQDVEQARANVEQTRAQLPSLTANLAEAEHALDALLGKPPGALRSRLAAAADFPAPATDVAVSIPANTLRQRPDVRAAERNLAAETARIGVAQAALYPALNLSGSIGLEALTLGALGNSGTSAMLAGITAPLFQGGRLRSQVAAQEAARDRALATYEQTVLAALQEVENALVALARNRERGEALARAAAAARSAAVMARQRYGAGLVDFQSVLDTERTVLSVEDNLATTRAENVLALIRLYKALGGGWTQPSPAERKETP